MNRSFGYGLVLIGLAITLVGCGDGTIPDPNDPNDVGNAQPEVLRSSLKGAADSLYERVYRREITDQQAQTFLTRYADDLLAKIKIEKVPTDKAWEYGEVFRTAKRWAQAQVFLKIAVAHVKNEDRRVNDSLRLAQVDCMLGKVAEGIKIAQSVYNTGVLDKAPILPAVLYEIAPAAVGKGHDVELADLLKGAIAQSEATVVDPKLDTGKAFLLARPHHIAKAWLLIVQLYTAAGRQDLAAAAGKQAAKSDAQFTRA